jgi:hypothetical protein
MWQLRQSLKTDKYVGVYILITPVRFEGTDVDIIPENYTAKIPVKYGGYYVAILSVTYGGPFVTIFPAGYGGD